MSHVSSNDSKESMQVESFFDPATFTITHVVHSGQGSDCAVVDSVLDYDPKSGRTATTSADAVIDFIHKNNLRLLWILETHAHADHLSAAPYLKKTLGGKIAIGESICKVQSVFKKVFNLEPEFKLDGSQFDYLFRDGEDFYIGSIKATVSFVPGHTPACAAYVMSANEQTIVFVGDTIFAPDVGTARCDFPGGDAKQLYQSMKKILSYPDSTRLYLCHDYPPISPSVDQANTRAPILYTTVAQERLYNIHINDTVSEEAFIKMRTARDASLAMPNLILPSIQINIRAGQLPPAENNGVSYLKIPINRL